MLLVACLFFARRSSRIRITPTNGERFNDLEGLAPNEPSVEDRQIPGKTFFVLLLLDTSCPVLILSHRLGRSR
jgi:hypothetical protein